MPGLNLTREEAIQRADVICVDHYDVELDLTRGDKDFFSRTTVTFSATEGETTFADLVSNAELRFARRFQGQIAG